MRNVIVIALRTAALIIVLLSVDCTQAQSFRRGGTEFNAVRAVTVPTGKPYTIIVTEFLHQGEIRADGRNVVVTAHNKELVPMRILQLGPGDVCRLAFQKAAGQLEYDIFYGGDPPTEKPPPWTCRDGLLLETRQYVACNQHRLDSLRSAFEKAAPIGADYVDGVFQSSNPFSLVEGPFLSRYSGYLDIHKSATYGFIVSSQDCSFLLVDGELVASAPGWHGPKHRALRGSRSDVKLAAGPHKFEYYHAASGWNAVMVAAWEINPRDTKPQDPTTIPPEVFHAYLVGHLPAGHLSLLSAKYPPDFVAKIVGDAPLPDNNVPLMGVQFREVSAKTLAAPGTKLAWDFGDGQTSDMPNVDHVYLRPGLYAVKLSIRHAGKTTETTNRIYVNRPKLTYSDKLYSLNNYLPIIEAYDPKTLDAASLRQMVLVLEAKALELEKQSEEAARRAKLVKEDPNRRPDSRKETTSTRRISRPNGLAEPERYLVKAVEAGKAAFVGESAAKGDEDLLKLAQLVGPMARWRLDDSASAFEIWHGAALRIAAARSKAECEIAAADVAINDLLKPAEAKPLLEGATNRLRGNRNGPTVAALNRVWGDYYAATGDGKSARKAYADAEQLGGSARPFNQDTAQRGAHARSTEDFIQQKQFPRAAEEIQAWQRDFPTQKIDGYLILLTARYWAGRAKYAQAIAQCEQLQAVNPDSPYVDQVLMLAADSEMRRGRKDRALATLHSLVKDYPGSPLAPLAKKNIAALEGGQK